MNRRDSCEHFERCGKSGHFFVDGTGMVPCPCLKTERTKRRLGRLWAPEIRSDSHMIGKTDQNLLVIAHDHQRTLRHLHPSALSIEQRQGRWADLGLQRVMDIWLSKDDTAQTILPILEGVDLLFFWLGYGEMINKERPGGILRVLDACAVDQIPVWVISKHPAGELANIYNEESARRLQDFKVEVFR